MRISELFKLDKTQVELDFVDVNLKQDTPLFLSPAVLANRTDPFSLTALDTVENFFQTSIGLIAAGKIKQARALFAHFHEPNETCLGLSRGEPRGRGVGKLQADELFESISNSPAAQSGLLRHLEDCALYIENIGDDKVSDMTTNIIRGDLIRYTQSQCKLHGIKLRPNTATGYVWNRTFTRWEQAHDDMLVIDGHVRLFVPKHIVYRRIRYSMQSFYQHEILDYMVEEELRTGGPLISYRQRDGSSTPVVYKKDLEGAGRADKTKDFVTGFALRRPELYDEFRARVFKGEAAIRDDTIDPDLDFAELVKELSRKLQRISPGNEMAGVYHRLIAGILEVIFYPVLVNPTLEREIHQGRKRIDLVFDNAAKDGVFEWLDNKFHLSCQYIFVECKNYSRDVVNPELDQLSGRFSGRTGRVGLLLSRTVDNLDTLIQRCADTYGDDRGLIIPIVDVDLFRMLEEKILDPNSRPEENFLRERIGKIALR